MDSFSFKGMIIGSVCAVLGQSASYANYDWKKYTDTELKGTGKIATSYKPYSSKYTSTYRNTATAYKPQTLYKYGSASIPSQTPKAYSGYTKYSQYYNVPSYSGKYAPKAQPNQEYVQEIQNNIKEQAKKYQYKSAYTYTPRTAYKRQVKPYVPQVKPYVPQVKPYVPEVKPYVPEVKPYVPQSNPQKNLNYQPYVPNIDFGIDQEDIKNTINDLKYSNSGYGTTNGLNNHGINNGQGNGGN